MGSRIYLWRWLIVLALWQPMVASAETPAVETPAIPCTISSPYKGTLFKSLYKTTEKTAKSLCATVVASRFKKSAGFEMAPILVDFAKESKEALDRLKLDKVKYEAQFSALENTFSAFEDPKSSKLPEFVVQGPEGGAEAFFQPVAKAPSRFSISELGVCTSLSPDKPSCRKVFEDFGAAFNPYRSAYNNVYSNSDVLAELAGKWDNFLDASKSQTFVEVGLTTWWFEREWWGLIPTPHFKKDYLVEPPPYQLVAIHPQLIYDFSTKSSTQNEVGLAVEWIGANFWDSKVPIGVSFATAYVSRSGVNDFGHGVMLHLFNHYAAGWARHGGVDSFYVTIDLLKAVQSKKSMYDKYMGYL